jgi:hypothetical protein
MPLLRELIAAATWLASCVPPIASSGAVHSGATSASDDRADGDVATQIITVPDVTGKTRVEAEAALRAAGVRGEIETADVPPGVDVTVAHVCYQNPGGGEQTSATLQVSIGFGCNEAPPAHEAELVLVGVSADEATRRLRAAGFTEEIAVEAISDDPACKPRTVCRVFPDPFVLDQLNRIELWLPREIKIAAPPEP